MFGGAAHIIYQNFIKGKNVTENDKLLENARDALMELFSDTSVSKEECRANLTTLRDEIDILLESLEG